MSQNPYIELSRSETLKILSFIENGDQYNPDKVRMMVLALSFTREWELLTCEDYTVLPYRCDTFLRCGNTIRPVRYSADPYADNTLGGIDLILNADTIYDYLRFYTNLYIVEGARLKILDHADDMDWIEDPAPVTRQSLEKELRDYPKITATDDGFEIMALCHFRTAIMEVTFDISTTGHVGIRDHRVLIDDLPVKAFA